MNLRLRTSLSMLAMLTLLANSIEVFRLQYSDPDSGSSAVSQAKGDSSPVSAAAMDDDHDPAKHADCNHGCHAASHQLTHLNSFPAILAIVPLPALVSSLLVTPVLFLSAERFFKPPR